MELYHLLLYTFAIFDSI